VTGCRGIVIPQDLSHPRAGRMFARSQQGTDCLLVWATPGAAWIETGSLACRKHLRSHSRFQALFLLPRAASRDSADCLPALWPSRQVKKDRRNPWPRRRISDIPGATLRFRFAAGVCSFRRSCPIASVRKAPRLYPAQLTHDIVFILNLYKL
jgi:hypothetical protein